MDMYKEFCLILLFMMSKSTTLMVHKVLFLFIIFNIFSSLSFTTINPNFISLSFASLSHPPSLDISISPISECGLNFSSLPYEPTGDCIGHQLKVDLWGIVRSKICCENALSVFSQALSIRFNNNSNDNGSIFLAEDQWKKCNQPFIQQSVSISSCGFDNLYNGSSKCSSMSLSAFKQVAKYQDAIQKCSQVRANASFDANCGDCNAAISDMRNGLLHDLDVDNGVEKAGCGVAIVISIAVARLQNYSDLSNDNFYRCLSASNQFDPGYIKIKSALAKEILAVLIAICAIALIILLIKYVTRSKRKETKPSNGKHKSGWSSFYQFSKEEIENAIVNGKAACLGRGSAGQVFKGILPSGQMVAIKQIYRSNASDTFEREVNGLMRVKHKNLVSLVGYCMGESEQYLVYEYCSAGNLAQHLLGKDKHLDWETRVRILRDCAVGLRFLHHHTDGCIVHRDIKLTNILLTKVQKDLEPKLSDFGLAKMLQIEHSKVYTDVRGTIGYMDPEYMSNAKLTCASDVYSFGIVTLQLLSGQQVIQLDLAARDQLTTKAKAVSMGQRRITEFIDPKIQGDVNLTDFKSILDIAVLCVSKSGKGRPPIGEVLDEMEKALKNTQAWKKTKKEASSSSSAVQAQKFEEIPV